MTDKLRDMLISLVQEQGAAFYAEPAQWESLRRLFPARRREIDELTAALECGIVAVLQNTAVAEPRRLVDAVELLQQRPQQFKYGDKSARWAAETWALALRVFSPEEMAEYTGLTLPELAKCAQAEAPVVIKITAYDPNAPTLAQKLAAAKPKRDYTADIGAVGAKIARAFDAVLARLAAALSAVKKIWPKRDFRADLTTVGKKLTAIVASCRAAGGETLAKLKGTLPQALPKSRLKLDLKWLYTAGVVLLVVGFAVAAYQFWPIQPEQTGSIASETPGVQLPNSMAVKPAPPAEKPEVVEPPVGEVIPPESSVPSTAESTPARLAAVGETEPAGQHADEANPPVRVEKETPLAPHSGEPASEKRPKKPNQTKPTGKTTPAAETASPASAASNPPATGKNDALVQTPHPTPTPEAPIDVSEKDVVTNATEKLAQMKKAFDEAKAFEKKYKSDEENLTVWRQFEKAYRDDLPGKDDDKMRKESAKRIKYWEAEKPPPVAPSF